MNVSQVVRDEAQQFREREFNYALKKERQTLGPCELELRCLRLSPKGTPHRALFALEAMKLQWGEELVLEAGGARNYWFEDSLKWLSQFNFAFLMGSASAGKTHLCAAWVYTMWKSSPWNTTVLVSSTSMEALEARAWGQIKQLFDADKYRVGTRVDHKNCIVLQEDKGNKNRDYNDAIKAIAIQKGSEGENAIKDIQGRKNKQVYWLLDEYAHMEPGVREARVNLMSNPHFQALHCSNKPNEGDPMYLDAMPHPDQYPAGWETEGLIERKTWKTKLGVCLYYDGEKSPNMQVEGDPLPVTSRRFVEQVREAFGEDSAEWWRQVKGFPKVGDIQDKVLTSEVLKNFGACEAVVWMGTNWITLAGLDLGFREDGDPCVADFGRVGKDISGTMVLAHESDTVQLNPKISSGGDFEDRISHAFLDECRKRECHHVALDISSDGGILALRLEKIARQTNWKLEILPISSLGAPDENEKMNINGEVKTAVELFDRKVSQLWYGYRLLVQARVIRGSNLQSKAVLQLCQRKVIQDEKKRYQVETKKKMKLRIKRSPDNADSRTYLAYLARKHGVSNAQDQTPVRPPVTIPGPPTVRRAYGSQTYRRAYAPR